MWATQLFECFVNCMDSKQSLYLKIFFPSRHKPESKCALPTMQYWTALPATFTALVIIVVTHMDIFSILFWQTVFHPDITIMVDWALKINYLISIYLATYEKATYDRQCRSVYISWRAPTGWRSLCQTPPWSSAPVCQGQSHHSIEPSKSNMKTNINIVSNQCLLRNIPHLLLC